MKIDKSEKFLIITADDFGMCDSVNRATMKALTAGIVTSCDIMPVGRRFNEAAAFCKDHPEIDVGVHAALISEFDNLRYRPILPLSKAKSLADADGYFWESEQLFRMNADINAVYEEVTSQIECVIAEGIKPTHLSMHMFISSCYGSGPEEFLKMILSVSKKYDLPFRIPREKLPKEYQDEGFAALDYLIWQSYYIPDKSKMNYYCNVLTSLRAGVNELIIHCGYSDIELKNITPWNKRYQADLDIFTDKDMKAYIEKLNIKPINWKTLKYFQEASLC